MGNAKVVSMSARPFQASLLSFEVGGILGELNVELGTTVSQFDFATFFGSLGAVAGPPAGDSSRLVYDSKGILGDAGVQACTVAALRAEGKAATLNRAINARQNTYYEKFANAAQLINTMQINYSIDPPLPGVPSGTKWGLLQKLSSISASQAAQLANAYQADSREGVVRTTTSHLTGQTIDDQLVGKAIGGQTSPPPPAELPLPSISVAEPETFTNSESTMSQTITNTDYGYRTPYLESQAQGVRAQISLMDQAFAALVHSLKMPHLTSIFQNDLQSIDLEVRQLQIAYLNTILLSPISGTVTGIYKSPGDAVNAGDPIIRVENNDTILVVAILIYRGPISIGAAVTIETSLFDSPTPATLTGSVVSSRGLNLDDQWEVIVKCSNMISSLGAIPAFPAGYKFDYDDTTVSIA